MENENQNKLDMESVLVGFLNIADGTKYNIFMLSQAIIFSAVVQAGASLSDAVTLTKQITDSLHSNNCNGNEGEKS